MATTTSPMKTLEDNLRNKAQDEGETVKQFTDKAKDTATSYTEKAKDVAAGATEKAKNIASNVVDKTKETVANLGQRAEDATHAIGRGMESLGGTVRENLPESGVFGTAASSLASGLESGGQYLEKEGLQGIGKDVVNLIRRNPIPALLLGIGLGFVIGRATTSTRS